MWQSSTKLVMGQQTRWSEFENPAATKGQRGKGNSGGKSHAAESLRAGETKTLLDVNGCGTVRRIWMTLYPRDLRTMRV